MSKRNFDDWIAAYLDYSSFGEAPKRFRFWCGVSALAGVLRRRVWLDMAYFQWTPNFFIILVAPPGIVSKSTTAGVSMNLLRQVPGIRFGPDACTWEALVQTLSESQELITIDSQESFVAAELTIESGELGNLLDPKNRAMVDLFITLWDGRKVFKKITKGNGSEEVQNPWINIIACTTPSWIAGNFPESMVGGGFTSRCVFVFAQEKERYVAYPGLRIPEGMKEMERKLVHDLEHISVFLRGPYRLLPSAVEWGEAWYKHHYENRPPALDDERFGGYIARKQTHIHKLAMVLAASQRDELTICVDDLVAANAMVSDLEAEMPLVFAQIGKNDESRLADRLVSYTRSRGGISYEEAYKFLYAHLPAGKEMEDVLAGAMKAGLIRLQEAPKGSGKWALMYSGNTGQSMQS